MSATWPASLPQAFKYQAPAETLGDGRKQSSVDRGPAMIRVATFVASDELTGVMDMSGAQWATLATFYKTTLVAGTMQFTMFDPKGGSDREVRFAGPPSDTQVGFDQFAVTLQLEVLS